MLSITFRFFLVKIAIVTHLRMKLAHAYRLKICWDHSCGYNKSCPDGLVRLFRTKVVTGHVGPAPKNYNGMLKDLPGTDR